MGKKEKKLCVLVDEFQSMIDLVPKLKKILTMHKEIAEGYQKYRKNGGDAIAGIEKHVGIKKPDKASPTKTAKAGSTKEAKEPKEVKVSKIIKKRKNKEKPHSITPIQDVGTPIITA